VGFRVILGGVLLCTLSACSPFRESVYVAPEVHGKVVTVDSLLPVADVAVQHHEYLEGITRSDEHGRLYLEAVKDYSSEVLKLSFLRQAQLIKIGDPQTEQSFFVVTYFHRLSQTQESVDIPTVFLDREPEVLASIPVFGDEQSRRTSHLGLNLDSVDLLSLVASACDKNILDSARLALNTARKVYWKVEEQVALGSTQAHQGLVDHAYQHVFNLWSYLYQMQASSSD